MRLRSTIGACLVASLVLVGVGCQPPARQSLHLRALIPASSSDTPMYCIRVLRIQHRVRPDAPVEDIWRLLGTTDAPYEKQALWKANDLRVGDGAHLAAARLKELSTETPDRSAQATLLTVRENMDFLVSLGGERDSLDLLWTDTSGLLLGRRFEKALVEFRLVCRGDTQDPQAIRITLAPEVRYGQEVPRWVRAETGYVQQAERETFLLADLAAEVPLRPGRMLVLSGRRTSDLSIGGTFFHERRGPDTWVQTIILMAEHLQPGQIPEGEAPFLPRTSPAVPSKTPPHKNASAIPTSPGTKSTTAGGTE